MFKHMTTLPFFFVISSVISSRRERQLLLDDLPLVSRHLTKLELHCVVLRNSSLDFTSCPALEVLQFNGCGLWKAKKIVSNSLKHLEIIWCCINDVYPDPYRVHISAPKLQSLHIDDIMDIAPMLDRMPSLVKAFIRLTDWGHNVELIGGFSVMGPPAATISQHLDTVEIITTRRSLNSSALH
ncbi:hypothetical protein EJB05_29306, partial [Eragrostis curvula]